MFGNKNFLGGLFSINNNFDIEKSLIEFYLYNKFILDDRYQLDLPEWLKTKGSKSIEESIELLFEEFFKEKEWTAFRDFYFKTIDYLKATNVNKDTEYDLSIEYNKFIKDISELEPQNYNQWIRYINKHIYKDLKGIK